MSQAIPSLDPSHATGAKRAALAWWMPALIALLAALVYANSLRNEFAFDDVGIVKNNPRVVDLDWTVIWHDNYWPKVEGVQPDTLYRPLTLWTYLANQAIAPGVAWPFHLVNVLLHALISALVAILAWRILGNRPVAVVAGVLFAVHPLHTEVVANTVGRAELLATTWSLLVLLIYLPSRPLEEAPAPVIRPMVPLIQLASIVSCVAVGLVFGCSQMRDTVIGGIRGATVGLGVGVAASLAIGFIARKVSPSEGVRGWWHGGLIALCFGAALLSKETPATLALGIVFIDAWRFIRWPKVGRPSIVAWFSSQAVRYYTPVALATGLYTLARINAGGLMSRAENVHRVVNPLVDATPLERIITPFMLLAKYLMLTLWPVHLSADYSVPSLMPTDNPFIGTAFQPPAIFGMLVCVLLVTLAIYFWKKSPQLLLLGGLAFLSYMLVANVVRIGTIFGERLFYWPSVFVLIMLAWGMVAFYMTLKRSLTEVRTSIDVVTGPVTTPSPGDVLNYHQMPAQLLLSPDAWKRVSTCLLASFVLAVGAMSYRTYIRNPDWTDNLSLAISTARDNPMSGKACSWAGSILVMQDDPQIVDFGRTLIERAVELTPDFVSGRWEIAKFYGLRGQMGESAIRVSQAAKWDPGTHMSRAAIPAVVSDLKRADRATYMPVLEAYKAGHPDDPAIYLAYALAYHAQGKWDDAEAMARKALDLAPPKRPDGADMFHEAGAELATIRFDRGNIEQAVITFRKYTFNVRNSVDARCTFVTMLMALDPKKNPDAVKEAEFNLAIADVITPNHARVRETRGELNRFKLAVARGETFVPASGVTAAAESKAGVVP